uniref:Histamine receptor H3 n=1 Tax=Otus sunia TaxID=257818 RepID=A0A8C8E9S1_9STRI
MQHPLLSHPRLPRAHSDILRREAAAAGTESSASLRTQNNFFLLNLAISDFLVGAFCIPLYVPYVLTGRWIFGRSLCKLWLVVDYLLCTSSVFNIVLISYDRFLSVTRAVAYRAQQGNTKRAVLKMMMVWVLAFLLYGPGSAPLPPPGAVRQSRPPPWACRTREPWQSRRGGLLCLQERCQQGITLSRVSLTMTQRQFKIAFARS